MTRNNADSLMALVVIMGFLIVATRYCTERRQHNGEAPHHELRDYSTALCIDAMRTNAPTKPYLPMHTNPAICAELMAATNLTATKAWGDVQIIIGAPRGRVGTSPAGG